ELVGERDTAVSKSRHPRKGMQGDVACRERAMNLRLLVAHDAPGRGVSGGCDVTHYVSAFCQVLGHSAAHVVVVEVVDDYRAPHPCRGGDVIACVYAGS